MIVDTSALAAIVFHEDGFENLVDQIIDAETPAGVPASVLVELGIVISSRLGLDARPIVIQLVETLGLEVIDISAAHWSVAVEAYVRFGRGRHPAALNFGDCLSYAAASVAGEPLLFVGDDFPQTDLGNR